MALIDTAAPPPKPAAAEQPSGAILLLPGAVFVSLPDHLLQVMEIDYSDRAAVKLTYLNGQTTITAEQSHALLVTLGIETPPLVQRASNLSAVPPIGR